MKGQGLPIVEPIRGAPDPEEVYLRLCDRPHCLFLDSALRDPVLGRYSFLAADPFDYFELPPNDPDCLGELANRMAAFPAETLPQLPPFQGGAAGLFGYDLGRQLEQLTPPAYDEFQVPAIAIGLYDVVVAFDHVDGEAWIISTGFPETESSARRRRATSRLIEMRSWLESPSSGARSGIGARSLPWVPADGLVQQYPTPGPIGLTSNFSKSAYLQAVRQAIEYIYAGDVFQVNLAQRLLFPAGEESVALYLRLRRRNPAPFAGYFDLGDFQVVSASPERFLQVRDRSVESRPIKGTRPRMMWPEADLFAGDELRQSEKDRAENVMIVDLLRNDLSRVCTADSVRVSQLCCVETFQFVQHLVSAIRGDLSPDCSLVDLIRATFPGGSITGAPKVRAMEIIAELEPTARGVYCGSLGYLGFDESLDLSILIRTITAGRGWWQAPVGGGIVAQSDPRREYEETWHKAEGLVRALVP